MSLALSRIGRLKPEVELGKAVSDFESILSVEERTGFQIIKGQTLSCPPSIRDVMALTAEIDQKARSQNGGPYSYRCFGPRFTKVVEAVQQYASIGDVIIGGSQNLIACGVWAAVRVSLLVNKLSSPNSSGAHVHTALGSLQIYNLPGKALPTLHEIWPISPTLPGDGFAVPSIQASSRSRRAVLRDSGPHLPQALWCCATGRHSWGKSGAS
jgi:hypothetical protein